MKHTIMIFCFLFSMLAANAQEQKTNLAYHFQQRLAAIAGTPAPTYAELLQVTDRIAGSGAQDIVSALPFLFAALKRDDNELAVQAAFALSVISRRPDGGSLLRAKLPEIAALLDRSDDRLNGGATLILRLLTPSISDLTVPVMMSRLTDPGKPSLAKVDLVSMLLDFRRSDPEAVRAIESFVESVAEPRVRIATLKVLGTHQVSTPKINDFYIRSLGDTNKHVKLASIYAVRALGSDVLVRARPVLSKIAVDLSEDGEVRSLADKALRDDLMKAKRQ